MDQSAAAINLLATLAMVPIVGFGAVWIVQRMVGGELDVVPGILGMGALFALFAVAILVPDQRMLGPVLVVLVVGMAFFPFAETQLEKNEMEGVDSSRIDKAHRELAVRPANMAARFELARALHDCGLTGHAIALAENTLNGLSSDRDIVSNQSMREKFRVEDSEAQRWRRQLKDPRAFDPVKCPSCGNMNSPGSLACEKCKGPYLLELARVKGGSKAIYARLILGFVLTGALLVACSWISTKLAWPLSAIGIGGALVAVSALMTWLYRPRTLRD